MAFVPAGGERDFYPEQEEFDFGDKFDQWPTSCSQTQDHTHELEVWPAKPSRLPRTFTSQVHNTLEEEMRLAIASDKIDIVTKILDGGFDPNTILRGGWTALMYSCDYGNLEIIKLLLERGANPNANKDMFTCLMALSCSKSCCEDDLSTSAQLLIDKGARVDGHDRHRQTSLLHACQTGHSGVVHVLLTFNADINKQDAWGWTPLCYAAAQGDASLVNMLLANGANPGISTHLGDTPVSLALSKDFTNVVSAIEGPDKKKQSSGFVLQREDVSVQYGDLELFLAGLQLSHLTPLFQAHQIKFSTLLSLTEEDLENIGVSQVGLRKKVLDAIVDLHKTQWKMPNECLSIKRALSLQEYSLVLSQLCSHIEYLSSSSSFLLQHTSDKKPSPVTLATEPPEQEELTNQVKAVVVASEMLHRNVKRMEETIYKGLGKSIPSKGLWRSARTRTLMNMFGLTIFIGSSFFIFVYLRKCNMFFALTNLCSSFKASFR